MPDPEQPVDHVTVAAGDGDPEPIPEREPERDGVDPRRGEDGGQHRCGVVVRRVELESHRPGAGAAGSAEGDVTGEDVLQPFGEDQPQCGVERHDRRRGRRERRVVLLLIRRGHAPSPSRTVAASLAPSAHGASRDGREREAGRRHQSLLRSRYDDVDSPCIRFDRHSPEARDRVDDRNRARLVACGDEAGCPRRRRSRSPNERVTPPPAPLSARERATSSARGDFPTVGQRDDVAAVRRRHLLPPGAEIPVRDDERLLARGEEVDDGRLERAGPRRGEDEHLVLGPEDLLQARTGLGEHLLEVGRAVVDHRLGQRGEHLRRNRRRARRQEIALLWHRVEGS